MGYLFKVLLGIALIVGGSFSTVMADTSAQHHKTVKHTTKKSHSSHHQKKSKKHKHGHRKYVPSTSANLDEAGSSIHFGTSMEARLVQFVQNSLENLRYSIYKPGGAHFDDSRGVYIADCSGFVDHVLKEIHPMAFSSIVTSMEVEKPNSADYYDFFSDLDERDSYWAKVDNIEQLRPGDILVVRYKNAHGHETGGHVMVVMDKPVHDIDSFMVRVADSAPAGHSEDTRSPHASGIGMGILRLRADPDTGEPQAFAWKIGSHWQNNVNIAMARPTDVTD